ncbi:MAG: 1-deoxy-D-xylulose-5-phosphate reductoisomerase [Firmicutes bacterium]|nr:1-deoxy-D-xylulose-5-phosphate reductoisomerase [Bacillota bacterium]
MAKKISIMGSTGSVGTQTLEVVDRFPEKFKIIALSARSNIDLLEKQITKYKPLAAAVLLKEKALELKNRLGNVGTEILSGKEGLKTLAAWPDADIVVVALVGFSGLEPTLAALSNGKTVALANKEALVVGGELIAAEAKAKKATIMPIDSEHSALFQCFQAGKKNEVAKVILTASGGPFLGWNKEELAKVTPSQALKHPNWTMGAKVTIDSATLMNKGFEVIEAHWLFNLNFEKIDVVVHPESIIHSMVEFTDGTTMAQMSFPSMLFPIQYALSYPERWKRSYSQLNWDRKRSLNFLPPDRENFPCLDYAYWAGNIGGTMPAVLNAANEIAVEGFLKNCHSFLHIPAILEEVMNRHSAIPNPSFAEITEADAWARKESKSLLQK